MQHPQHPGTPYNTCAKPRNILTRLYNTPQYPTPRKHHGAPCNTPAIPCNTFITSRSSHATLWNTTQHPTMPHNSANTLQHRATPFNSQHPATPYNTLRATTIHPYPPQSSLGPNPPPVHPNPSPGPPLQLVHSANSPRGITNRFSADHSVIFHGRVAPMLHGVAWCCTVWCGVAGCCRAL